MLKELISSRKIKNRVAELGREISTAYAGKEIVMVVLLRGSFVFAADLIRVLEPETVVDFMVVSSYQGENTSGEVRILKDLADNIHGRHILIVEDIVDTGLTLNKILTLLQSRSPQSIAICSMLNKPSRRIQPVDLQYVGFEVEDQFVVGYGLDMDQKYRQLPYIGELV
ncbi:hypoxanthine phosphoribosyltransferase [bacterium]|nr:hypoxanthine phosphoribosyltransferase [bacterium]